VTLLPWLSLSVTPAHDGPPGLARERTPACLDLVVEIRKASEARDRSEHAAWARIRAGSDYAPLLEAMPDDACHGVYASSLCSSRSRRRLAISIVSP
jgi:hypothetical protein